MRAAAIALLIANALDTATLLIAFWLLPDPVIEANPLVLLLASRYGLLAASAIKMCLVILVATWGLTSTQRYRPVGVGILAACAFSGTVGTVTNLAVILALIGVR